MLRHCCKGIAVVIFDHFTGWQNGLFVKAFTVLEDGVQKLRVKRVTLNPILKGLAGLG
tara:strand:+ start:546 stop:719 length:174 start_codon:yes stop_codon:yes gene_type:complete